MQPRQALAIQLVAFASLITLAETGGGCAAGSESAPTGPVASATDSSTATGAISVTHAATTTNAGSTGSVGGAGSTATSSDVATNATASTVSTTTNATASNQAASTTASTSVATSSVSSSASSGSGGCAAYAHTITIDGTNDFSANETFATTSSPAYTAYVTWDASNVYVGMTGPDIDSGDGNKWVQIYFGGSGGTQSGLTYNTQHATLPFPAKWHVRWKADNTFTNAQVWSGTSWGDAAWNFSGLVFKNGNYLELAIPRSNIGSPTGAVDVHVAMVNETANFEGSYAGVPSTSFVDSYNPTYAHYFAFDLASCNTPLSYSPL